MLLKSSVILHVPEVMLVAPAIIRVYIQMNIQIFTGHLVCAWRYARCCEDSAEQK